MPIDHDHLAIVVCFLHPMPMHHLAPRLATPSDQAVKLCRNLQLFCSNQSTKRLPKYEARTLSTKTLCPKFATNTVSQTALAKVKHQESARGE